MSVKGRHTKSREISGDKPTAHPPTASTRYLVVMDDSLCKSLVQHLLVPLLQALRFWDFLIRGVAMEDVVISFTRGTGPDVSCHIPAGHIYTIQIKGLSKTVPLPSRSTAEEQGARQG